ncbi:MAG: hypothetical protein WAK82_40820 [Streptosporangiaceae bacterium]
MPTKAQVQTVTVAGTRRVLVGLLWGLIQAAIVLALLSAGGVAAAYLDRAITGRTPASPVIVLIGLAGGVAAGLSAGHKARTWLQEARLRRLRAAGVSVRATVDRLDRQCAVSGRGPGLISYVVYVHWQDPATGADCHGERRYRFSGHRSQRLEVLCGDRARVAVYYPARHLSRFVIDVPFAPTMADFFG